MCRLRLLASQHPPRIFLFFFNDTATTEIYTFSLHDALPISLLEGGRDRPLAPIGPRDLSRLRRRPVGGRRGAHPRCQLGRPEPGARDHDSRRHGEPRDGTAPGAWLRRPGMDRRRHATRAARPDESATAEARRRIAAAVGGARRAGITGGTLDRRRHRGDRWSRPRRLRPAARRVGGRCRGKDAASRGGPGRPTRVGGRRHRRAATQSAMTTMSATFLSDAAERLRASVVGIANGRRDRRAAGGAAIAWSSDLFVTSAPVVTASHAKIVTAGGRAGPGEGGGRGAQRDIAVWRGGGAGGR